jgi:hypothetical protein
MAEIRIEKLPITIDTLAACVELTRNDGESDEGFASRTRYEIDDRIRLAAHTITLLMDLHDIITENMPLYQE